MDTQKKKLLNSKGALRAFECFVTARNPPVKTWGLQLLKSTALGGRDYEMHASEYGLDLILRFAGLF